VTATLSPRDTHQRFFDATRRARELTAQSAALVARSRQLRGAVAAGGNASTADAAVGSSQSLLGFRLEGWLGDRRVRASYEDDRLSVDDRLATQAKLLVDLGEVFELDGVDGSTVATLDGSPRAVFLTLVRACERVTDASFAVTSVR
jgi:type II secretory pathway pseudopilin PulG